MLKIGIVVLLTCLAFLYFTTLILSHIRYSSTAWHYTFVIVASLLIFMKVVGYRKLCIVGTLTFNNLGYCMLTKSSNRALISLITILVVRVGLWMMRSKALDAAEEWIKSTLLYLSFCFLAAIKEYVLDLCWRWLKVIYNAFPGLCDSLYLYVFGPQVRGQRPRRRY